MTFYDINLLSGNLHDLTIIHLEHYLIFLQVCTTLTGCLHHAECAIDSDATESESGGDSSTEIDYENAEETTKPPM